MRVTRIENTSDVDVTLIHEDNRRTTLRPGDTALCCRIVNLDEVKRNATVIQDLSEVVGD